MNLVRFIETWVHLTAKMFSLDYPFVQNAVPAVLLCSPVVMLIAAAFSYYLYTLYSASQDAENSGFVPYNAASNRGSGVTRERSGQSTGGTFTAFEGQGQR